MRPVPVKPWFRPKVRGVGWTPCSWEGWLATALLLAAILASGLSFGRTPTGIGLAVAAGLSYLVIILLTRGPPDHSNPR